MYDRPLMKSSSKRKCVCVCVCVCLFNLHGEEQNVPTNIVKCENVVIV